MCYVISSNPFLQITAFIKACKEQIDVLKNSIRNEEANSKGWLGLAADNFNADTVAHNMEWYDNMDQCSKPILVFLFFSFRVSRCNDIIMVAGFDSEREASFSHCTI